MVIFSVNFTKTMFQKDMYKFFKREGMFKSYFQWISNVSNFVYKGIFFNDFFQCLFKKYVQRYIFFYFLFFVPLKGFFNDFLFV